MDNTAQWIPLSGPGGRLPTSADSDNWGNILVLNYIGDVGRHPASSTMTTITHWAPIPKAPPLPKPVEKTQQEIDMEKVNNLLRGNADLIIFGLNCLTHGRSDGRAQLARGALGLFDGKYFYRGPHSAATSEGVILLHELLTKAAEEKP